MSDILQLKEKALLACQINQIVNGIMPTSVNVIKENILWNQRIFRL